MFGYYGYGAQRAALNELMTDAWIQRNVPGGLNSPLGKALDEFYGGNPNPTFGQRLLNYQQHSAYRPYGSSYGYYRGYGY